MRTRYALRRPDGKYWSDCCQRGGPGGYVKQLSHAYLMDLETARRAQGQDEAIVPVLVSVRVKGGR